MPEEQGPELRLEAVRRLRDVQERIDRVVVDACRRRLETVERQQVEMLILAGPLSVGVLSFTVAVPEEWEEADCRVVLASLDVVVSGDDLQQVIAVPGR